MIRSKRGSRETVDGLAKEAEEAAGKGNLKDLYMLTSKRGSRETVDGLAKEAEEATGKGNLKDLYMLTRKLSEKFLQTDKPVKYRNGIHSN